MLKHLLPVLLLASCGPQPDGLSRAGAPRSAEPHPAADAPTSAPTPAQSAPPGDFESHTADLDWLDLLRPDHREALEQIGPTWRQALAEVRAAGQDDEMGFYGAVIDPEAAMQRLREPAPATYVCRMLLLGTRGGSAAFIGYPSFECEVVETADGRLQFAKMTGSQRFDGEFRPFSDERMLFLGAAASAGKTTSRPRYGGNVGDYFGVLEQVGEEHWRIVMPRPERAHRVEILEFWSLPPI